MDIIGVQKNDKKKMKSYDQKKKKKWEKKETTTIKNGWIEESVYMYARCEYINYMRVYTLYSLFIHIIV